MKKFKCITAQLITWTALIYLIKGIVWVLNDVVLQAQMSIDEFDRGFFSGICVLIASVVVDRWFDERKS